MGVKIFPREFNSRKCSGLLSAKRNSHENKTFFFSLASDDWVLLLFLCKYPCLFYIIYKHIYTIQLRGGEETYN